MRMQNVSVRRFLKGICGGAALTVAAALAAIYRITGDGRAVLWGLIPSVLLFAWGAVFLYFFQRMLSQFTDSLCRTLDGMMSGGECPQAGYETETLLARISHRLERLYGIMQESRRKVESERAELQSLVSDISQQTRTPIANLKMLNETLLTRTMPEEKRREFLEAAGSQLDKLDFLIQALVKTSRLETGVIVLEKKEAPVADTLAAALSGVLALLEMKGLMLSVDCPQNLTVAHDSRWTSEALYNLLDNAVKYTPPGGSIRITVQEWELYVRIDIADTGRGIPEGAQAAIFKRFYREKSVHEVDGIGIGLYLAREIAMMQGGYLSVSSEVGRGTVFSLFLPRRSQGGGPT